MQAVYRSAPAHQSIAPAKAFSNAQDALEYARKAADTYWITYSVYESADGRLKHLQTFRPADRRA